jgi:peptide/nickel transport system ATP-binding protein
MRYLPRNGKIAEGSILFEGQDMTLMSDPEVASLRKSAISMIYQNPLSALNPTIRIGHQLAEVFRLNGHTKEEAFELAGQALQRVHIADPEKVMRRYPHHLSGGMAQRVVIAMALASNPRLLIMDEPTTGLDATVEAEVLDLVRELRRDTGTAVLFISHNLGVIRHMCDRARQQICFQIQVILTRWDYCDASLAVACTKTPTVLTPSPELLQHSAPN